MKPFERRAAKQTTYYKLEYYDDRAACWHATKPQYDELDDLRQAAERLGPGKYRVSIVEDGKPRLNSTEFTIEEGSLGD